MNLGAKMMGLTLGAPMDGWVIPLEDVPDSVFAERLLGDGIAIDPLDDKVCAPARGVVIAVHEARHAVTLRLDAGPTLLIHFGLESVSLGGAGFTSYVQAGQRVNAGDPLLTIDLATVAQGSRSLVTPILITEAGGYAIDWSAEPGRIGRGQPVLTLVADHLPERHGPSDFDAAVTATIRVPLAHGLHARPCARIAEAARRFDAELRVQKGDREARLRSPSSVMTLAIRHGDTISILASGSDAQAAVDTLSALIESGMGEGKDFAGATPPMPRPSTVTTPRDAPFVRGELRGVEASPGFALGIGAHLVRPEPEIEEESEGSERERIRLSDAVGALKRDLEIAKENASAEQRAIMDAHEALLGDEDLTDQTNALIDAGASAAVAWRRALHAQADALRAAPDPHIAERAQDLLDIEVQLQWRLAGQTPPASALPERAIILAEDLVPSQVIGLDPNQVAGIVTAQGGPTSHVAIIAASKGIPALVAVGHRVLAIPTGSRLLLDTAAARLDVGPDDMAWHQYEKDALLISARKKAARASAELEGRTLDGHRIEVAVNLGRSSEAEHAVAGGAEGCGLLRTELLFLDRDTAPDEEEQTAEYSAIARALRDRPLVIRLLDIGGDKPAPYLPIAAEENPALGVRGIRIALQRPDILATQLRAILRAGAAGNVRVMVPMIAKIDELRAVRSAMLAEARDLGVAATMPLGVMVETPAAAIMADRFAAECDFLSIGTNDLTQYTLAMDRGNPAIAKSLDGLDPAVLRMIDMCCRGGANHGKPVSVCGGLASDRLAVPILIGLGVAKLSAAEAAVADVKALVRGVTLSDCRMLAARVLQVSAAAEVRSLATAFLRDLDL